MRTITCIFFAVVTLLLGNISAAGIGRLSDPFAAIAAFFFLIAAVVFAVLDWPGLPTRDVADRMVEDEATRTRRRPAGE